MKGILKRFASLIPVRMITLAIMYCISFLQRLWSIFRYRAMVKNCSNSICHYSTEIKYGDRIKVGENSRIGPGCTLGGYGGIIIGKNVVISKNVSIESAGLDLTNGPPFDTHKGKPIVIEDNVWIGSHAIILSGVTIGANVVIGAGVVVSKNIESGKVVVGQPFRILN